MYFRASWYRLSLLAVSFVFVWFAPAKAQKAADPAPVVKFGKVSPDQFRPSLADSTAEAVVLYNLGQVRFEVSSDQIWLILEQHVRTQIRRKSAYDRATITIPARRGKAGQHEFVSDFDGSTYNLVNGAVTTDKLTKTGQFTEKISDTYWVEKYTLPNVREGSIIEYKYTTRTPFTVSTNPKIWYFQENVPVKWSEYRITIPNYFYYNMILGGYLSLTLNERTSANVSLLPGYDMAPGLAYRFAVKDAPAFRDEAYITTDNDYLSKIDFELASYTFPTQVTVNFSVGWEAMDRTLLDDADFGGQIKRASFLRDLAKSLLGQHQDTLSRVTAAYDHIRQRVKWTGEAALWSKNIRKIYEDRKGDAADINLLLIALLREMDIPANPVILSTRSHGRVDQAFALLKRFNYVVAQVPIGGKDLLLDATDQHLIPGMLPTHCLNGTGRLVHSSKSRFISLVPTQRDHESVTAALVMDKDGHLSGTLAKTHMGYSAWSARKALAADGRAKYLEKVQKEKAAWEVEKADFKNPEPTADAFREVYTLSIPEACSQAGDRLYFQPMITEAYGENPFKEADRLYPVDFGAAIDRTFYASYTIPAGFVVEELPKDMLVSLPENGGRFAFQVQLDAGNQLKVVSRISLREPVYLSTDYHALREFFNQIVTKQAEQVVLKRVVLTEKK